MTEAALRIIVTGSREYDDERSVFDALDRDLALHGASLKGTGLYWVIVIVHGKNKRGADAIAAKWVKVRKLSWGDHVREEPHEARWNDPCRDECKVGHRRKRSDGSDYCPAAGNYRNQEMADAGAGKARAFFKQGAANKGTSDCVRRAMAARIPVERITDAGT